MSRPDTSPRGMALASPRCAGCLRRVVSLSMSSPTCPRGRFLVYWELDDSHAYTADACAFNLSNSFLEKAVLIGF